MSAATDYAFDNPIGLLQSETVIRTASQAAEIVRSKLRTRFTMQGLNTILMLERALAGDEVEVHQPGHVVAAGAEEPFTLGGYGAAGPRLKRRLLALEGTLL